MNFCMSSKIKNIFWDNMVQSVSFHYSHEWIYLFDRKPSFGKQSHQLFIYIYIYDKMFYFYKKKCHVKFQICNISGRAPIASKIKVHIQDIANHCKWKSILWWNLQTIEQSFLLSDKRPKYYAMYISHLS